MKKYLEKAKDVIDALKSGREIKLENGGCGKIYLIDGLVVKENIDGYHINYTINQKDKPYIEIDSIIKVGEFYKTREGRKAHCFFVDKDFRFCRFTIDGLIDVVETNKDGEHLIAGRFENEKMPNDIVGYWFDGEFDEEEDDEIW